MFPLLILVVLITYIVTKSKLTLLTAWQAKKLGDKVLRQGIATLFGKPGIWEGGGRVS